MLGCALYTQTSELEIIRYLGLKMTDDLWACRLTLAGMIDAQRNCDSAAFPGSSWMSSEFQIQVALPLHKIGKSLPDLDLHNPTNFNSLWAKLVSRTCCCSC